MNDFLKTVYDELNPLGLVKLTHEKGGEVQVLILKKGELDLDIWHVKKDIAEIRYHVEDRVLGLPAEDRKDPTTGRLNVEYRDRLIERYLREDADYIDASDNLSRLTALRMQVATQLKSAEVAYQEVRVVSELAGQTLESLSR
jgi:hypothetical protein